MLIEDYFSRPLISIVSDILSIQYYIRFVFFNKTFYCTYLLSSLIYFLFFSYTRTLEHLLISNIQQIFFATFISEIFYY